MVEPSESVAVMRRRDVPGVAAPIGRYSHVAMVAPGQATAYMIGQMEILRLLSSGKSLSEIAWLVHSSYNTVANTSSILRQTLGVRTSV